MRNSSVATVGAYLALVPAPARAALRNLRTTIMAAAPRATEGISYGMPTVKLAGHSLVYYAAFKSHCSLFPASKAVLATHKTELKAFEVSKGTIHFTAERPLPAALVRKMVRARIKENEARWPSS